MDERKCTACKETKPVADFRWRKDRKALNSHCRRCCSLKNMKLAYGISIADYDKLLKKQNSRCAVCGSHADAVAVRGNIHRSLVVDHSHSTGTVRGLLCHGCNVALGHFKDDTASLQAAITYLRTTS